MIKIINLHTRLVSFSYFTFSYIALILLGLIFLLKLIENSRSILIPYPGVAPQPV